MVHPRDGHPKIFAMIDAYFDESGIHKGALACVVAGYFGDYKNWKRLENDWKKVLRQFKVPLKEFHALDLIPKPRGWFEHHWNGDHAAFLDALADTIAKHRDIHPMSGGILVKDFNSFAEHERRYFTGATLKPWGKVKGSASPNKPYFVPFQHCIIRVCNYTHDGEKAHFFFGLDRLFYGYASILFQQMANSPRRGKGFEWKDRLGDPSYPKARETPQLQAADLLANLNYRHMVESGKLLGCLAPSELLSRCVSNRLSDEDFFFTSKSNLSKSLEVSEQMFGIRPLH